MDVILGLHGDVIVDHVGNLVDIDSAGEHIGCNEDVGDARREIIKRSFSLVLAPIGMDRLGGETCALELSACRVGAVSRPCENDDASGSPATSKRAMSRAGFSA